MIRDGKLGYDATPSALHEFEFESAVLNTVVIAILTTILSYQAASLAFDIFFGIKSRNKARISDIHTLLLTRQSSPLSVYASILRLDWLTRLQFWGNMQKGADVVRDRNRVQASVVGKLLFLLALVPLLNVGSIVLNFTRKQTISFSEAHFGGTYLDVNADLSVAEVEPMTRSCEAAVIETARTDRSNVTFYLCRHHNHPVRLESEIFDGSASIILLGAMNTTAHLQVRVGRYAVHSEAFADVSINGTTPFRLRSTLSAASAQPFVDYGIDLLIRKCRSEHPLISEMPENATAGQDGAGDSPIYNRPDWGVPDWYVPDWAANPDMFLGKLIQCSEFADDESRITREVSAELLNRITLVEADVFELEKILVNPDGSLDLSKQEFFRADDYPFLIRTQPYVSLPMLTIITAVVLVVRIILKLLLNNDVSEGVHRLVKVGLGFHYWESLLRGVPHVTMCYQKENESGISISN